MIFYVTVGGMKGTTWVQIVKAVLLMAGTVADHGPGAGQVRLQPLRPARRGAENTGKGEAFLEPGLKYGATRPARSTSSRSASRWCSAPPGLPHILIRFYTVPTARDARKSVLWAIGLIGTFYLMTLVLGFGAAALLDTGPRARSRRPAATWRRRCWPRRSAAATARRAARSCWH